MPKRDPADADAFVVLHTKIGAINSVHEGDVILREDCAFDIPQMLSIGAIRPATADEVDAAEEKVLAAVTEGEAPTEEETRLSRARPSLARSGKAGRSGTPEDLTDGDGNV